MLRGEPGKHTVTVTRKRALDMRQYIVDAFKAGNSQSKIARDLGISPATVHNYLRSVGVLGTEHGRRICSRCGKAKTQRAFRSPRSTVCRMCYKG